MHEAGVGEDRYLGIVGQVAGAQECRAPLVRVDAASEVMTFDLPVGIADALVDDGGSLWTMGREAPGRGPRVLRIDPATGTVSADISVAAAARCVPGGRQRAPASGSADGGGGGGHEVPPRAEGPTVPIALAVAPGSVWVLHYGGTLTRVAVG